MFASWFSVVCRYRYSTEILSGKNEIVFVGFNNLAEQSRTKVPFIDSVLSDYRKGRTTKLDVDFLSCNAFVLYQFRSS